MPSTCARWRTRSGACCPGPTYVKSFLRTYADALGLDAKLLIEEYKLRHERPSDHELSRSRPAPPRAGGGTRGRPAASAHEPRRIPPGVIIGVIVVLLFGALYRARQAQPADEATAPSAATTTDQPDHHDARAGAPTTTSSAAKAKSSKKKASASSRLVRLQIVPTGPGPVYVCLVDASGAARDPRHRAAAGRRAPGPYRSKRFRCGSATATCGCASTASRATCPTPARSATDHARGRSSASTPATVPDCAMSARAGIVVTGTEVLTGRVADRNGPWLSERLRELGVDLAHTIVVGDRPRGHARRAGLAGERRAST